MIELRLVQTTKRMKNKVSRMKRQIGSQQKTLVEHKLNSLNEEMNCPSYGQVSEFDSVERAKSELKKLLRDTGSRKELYPPDEIAEEMGRRERQTRRGGRNNGRSSRAQR